MSNEWTNDGERSSEVIQFHAHSRPIRCKFQEDWVEMLDNPIVGANLMSKSFAHTHVSDEHIVPTATTLRTDSCSHQQWLGLIHNITIQHEDVVLTLDFHIFNLTTVGIS